jgi:uncharacterized protein YjbJ (UPF0337 family)
LIEKEKHLKHTNIKIIGFLAAIVLMLCSLRTYAEESQDKPYINKDQVEGRVEEGKGKVKEVTGKILGDKSMEVEGNIQKNVGKAQAGFGDLKKDIKEGN